MELQATPGFEFFDLKYSGMSLVSVPDIPVITSAVLNERGEVKPDAEPVNIGGANKVYGPYKIDRLFSRGNGKLVFVAFKVGSNGKSQKPLTKAELEALTTDQAVQLAAMKAQLAAMQATKK